MSIIKHDLLLQEYVNIIYNEGRMDDLLGACDYYHPEITDKNAAFEWGITLGQYIGKFHYNSFIYKFEVIGNEYVLYFIGTLISVKDRITKIL